MQTGSLALMSRNPTNERSPTAAPRRTDPPRIRAISTSTIAGTNTRIVTPDGDQPGKILAQAVEVSVDPSPVDHHEAEVEKARDQADPDRQQQDRGRADAIADSDPRGSLVRHRLGYSPVAVPGSDFIGQVHPRDER